MGEGRPGWLLDELRSCGRENLDADHVARYDAKMDSTPVAEVALLESLGLDRSSTLVDLGAGTGQLVRAAAPRCRRVVAADVSPVMLAALRATVADHRNVSVVNAGFLTYEHAGDAPDFVYSRYALHHLPDFWKAMALARVHALLRPGGVFRLWDVVYNFDPSSAPERIEGWCAAVDGWERWELEEHVRDENSTFTWVMEAMLERAGFAIEDATYSADGFDARYVARARPVA